MPQPVKLSIIYYSSTGANYKIALWAQDEARNLGAEVRLRKVQELAPDSAIATNPSWKEHHEATREVPTATLADLEWADALLFCVPTRYGNLPAQIKQFLDSTGGLWSKGKLTNKVVSGTSSAANPHGGQEATLLALYTTMYHWGAIVVTPGYTNTAFYAAGGNPYGTSATVDQKGEIRNDIEPAVRQQVARLLKVAGWVQQGQRAESDADTAQTATH